MENILEVSNISKLIQKKRILSDITLSLKPGDVLALIGPNGAGKTTLLRTITNLASVSSGTVKINGQDVRINHHAAMSRVGSLIEAPEFYNHLTGKQNLKLFANMTKNRISDVALFEHAKQLDIYQALDEKLSTYSLGMRQRLGICVSLLNAPNLLLLDEPLNGLDPLGVIQVKKLIDSLVEQGASLIISSHQLSELENMCTRYVMLEQGSITTEGVLNKRDVDIQAASYFTISTTNNRDAMKLLPSATLSPRKNELNVQMNVPQLNAFIQECLRKEIYLIEIKKDEEQLVRLFHPVTEEQNNEQANS